MHRAALTLTIRVVELTIQLSFENHQRAAAKCPTVPASEPRPLANTRPAQLLKAVDQ